MDATHQLNSRLFGSSCRSGYYYSRGSCYRSRSSFSSWGRWVLLGVIVFVALCAFLLCTCCARRRRGKGSKPMYGTGWMAPTGGKWGVNNNNNQQTYGQGYNQGGYNQGYDQSQGYNQGGYNQGYTQNQGYNAPPAYGQQPQQQYDANQGYYGNQQYSGVQQPANAYNRDAPVGDVSAPPGPPPGK